MTETEYQIVKSIGFVAALCGALALQRMRPHDRAGGSWRTNGALWILNAVLLGVVCGGCGCAAALWARDAGLGLTNLAGGPAWLGVPLTIVGLDLVSYLWHRANHRVSLLWRFHQAHHSDRHHTVTTALRFHPGELLLALPVRLLAVVLLGAPVLGLIAFEVVFAFANLWEHGDIDLPPRFEDVAARVFITPALHRRHHGVEARLLDSNYGTIFSFWDRLLGSFGPSDSSRTIETGLPGLMDPIGLPEVLGLPGRGVFRGR